jgi:Beta-propeller repeat
MRRILSVVILILALSTSLAAQNKPSAISTEHVKLMEYERLALNFEVNVGQMDPSVRFFTRGPGYSLFLGQDDAVISLKKASLSGHSTERSFRSRSATGPINSLLRMRLVGANPNVRIDGVGELTGKANYFIGNDPSKWRTNVPTYSKVKFEGVYPGIDLIYYGNQGQLEYDFVVAPGSDPNAIGLRFRSRNEMTIDANGDLLLRTEGVRFQKPQVFQDFDGMRKNVDARYELSADNTIHFVVGEYDPGKPLVIDPVLSYSTYLGGSLQDFGSGIAVDPSGNAYITGQAFSFDFPTANALQPTNAGGGFDPSNVFITKINAKGSALVYSTYLGGLGRDAGSGIAVDPSGNVYVTGSANSFDFPTVNALEPVSTACCGVNGTTGFVAKLNPTGSALIYSTFLGGFGEDSGSAIAADDAGNAYVTGMTSSPTLQGCGASCNFPTTAHALQPNLGGTPGEARNAFVTKISPAGSAFVFSTYLGGSNADEGSGIAVDTAGNVYVTGGTGSSNFPTANAVQPTLKGTENAFVTKINASGTSFIYSTYLGGTGADGDGGGGIAADSSGNAYVAGQTSSSDFPTAHPLQSTLRGNSDVFVTKLDPSGTSLVYSTFLGGSDFDSATGLALDDFGDVFVAGLTKSLDFPTLNPIQPTFGGGNFDVFVTEINPTGSGLVYSTYLGGTADEFASGIAVNAKGRVVITGNTTSTNFPTEHAFQPALGAVGATNAFVLKIVGDDPSYVHALSDLYTARNHLARVEESDVSRETANAIQEIDEAIAEIRIAITDDDKDPHEHPPVDAGPDRTGPFHRSEQLLEKARKDISLEEDNGSTQQLQHSAIGHIDKAIQDVEAAIQFIATHS